MVIENMCIEIEPAEIKHGFIKMVIDEMCLIVLVLDAEVETYEKLKANINLTEANPTNDFLQTPIILFF